MKIRIFAINDIYKLENLSKFKIFVENNIEDVDKYYTTLSGDFLSPSPLFSLDKAVSMIDILNRINLDFCCFGNHEFDYGVEICKKRILELNSNTKLVNSNIKNFPIDLPEYYISEIKSSNKTFKIGWLGLCY